MQSKTFESFSVQEAIRAVKKEYGHDAVILNTREYNVPGKGKMFQVTASAAVTSRPGGAAASFSGISTEVGRDIESRITGLDIRLSAILESLPTKRSVQNLESSLHEMKVLLLESLREKDGSCLKDLPEYLVNIERQLRYTEVSDMHIAQLMNHLRSIPMPSEHGESLEDHFRAQAIRWMLKRIRIAPRWNVTQGSSSVQAIVGPTGAGKTSLVAKLAAHYKTQEKVNVLLVSFDNQRLGAAEQLRIYAKLLDIPFVAIQAAEELPRKMIDHSHAELVLIDTAGRSAKAEDQIKDLKALRSLTVPVDFHLTLSTTERPEQLDRSVRSFGQLGLQSLLFTKLDESWSFGEVYNVSSKWSLPISFFSTGSSVPDNFERASRERVIERIFGI